MGRVLGAVLVLVTLMLAGCSEGTDAPKVPPGEKEDVGRGTEEDPKKPPAVKGPDYEVVEVVPLEESDPEFYEGPIGDAGISAAEVRVRVDGEGAIQPAYLDATHTLTDYDLMNLDFYKGGELLNELFYFRTEEARQAHAAEAMAGLRELTEVTATPPPGSVPSTSVEPTTP